MKNANAECSEGSHPYAESVPPYVQNVNTNDDNSQM